MGTTKKKSFNDDVNSISEIFKAIGHPARLQILTILLENKQCTCGTIVEKLPLSQSTVSKHLLELKKASLIGEYFEGKKTIFFLKKDGFKNSTKYINEFYNICKFKDVFSIEKNTPVLNKKVSKNINLTTKYKNRKANPGLKKQNYVFTHLKNKP